MNRHRQTPRRRLIADRAARWIVSAGGIAIIASILGILIFILLEVAPLTFPAHVDVARKVAVPGAGRIGALLSDDYRTHVATLDETGQVRVVRLADGKEVYTASLAEPGTALTGALLPPQSKAFAAATSNGRVLIKKVDFAVTFEGDNRVVKPDETPTVFLDLDPAKGPLGAFAAQMDGDGNATAAAVLADGPIAIVRRAVEQNEFTGEATESINRAEVEAPGKITAMVIDPTQKNLYAGTAGGDLLWWPLADGQPGDLRSAGAGAPVTALNLLLGGRSLAVGQENGALSVWFPVEQPDGSARLTRTHEFPRHPGAVRRIAPSQRDRSFLALGGGRLGLYFSTSDRTLWTGRAPLPDGSALFYAPKADGALLGGRGQVAAIDVRNPHPEVTLKSLFGKVWYEGYAKPSLVWQSSGGSDDFEPKLSLTPLLVGTLKGTFYSLLLAIPLGILGAMYVSQFMHPTYKRYVKPMIEIMASLPSVVLGFLAGLWLAPRIERAVPGLALMAVLLPLCILLAGFLWSRLPRTFRGRFPVGTEALLFVFVLAAGIGLCFKLSPGFERLAFGGDFQAWLLHATGLGYDQRNAVVVGLAMGFAVIPILFAIAEDAFSNVPRNLVAGSLALGADRWQTVTRVVLPTASPGIFSAVMVGFGRAVGETMIVLMATGNTPILSWNPFNGFRTLSANIAVEIPEAPHGGTLYRTLFLAGLLLFVMTFLVNTVAELVRQRLRERFSQL
ncbi:MAG TPA: ABC transporter permease subunit [Thermoanaerobaculia bacterium]|jgi:phosphate transport system permease protein|nr:ABC transporter permease subunit [Thermoanaerobaculia bacterium]